MNQMLSLFITREYEKTIVSTNAINKLADPTSKFHALSQKHKKRKADARRQLHARKKAALEKMPILTEENTTLNPSRGIKNVMLAKFGNVIFV